jgi:hypothetical protein
VQASLLQEVAATGTRARRLAAGGFVVFALGIGTVAGLVLHFVGQVNEAVVAAAAIAGTESPAPSVLGPAVHGAPIGVLGLAAAFIGLVTMTVGIVPHLAVSVQPAERRRGPRLRCPVDAEPRSGTGDTVQDP